MKKLFFWIFILVNFVSAQSLLWRIKKDNKLVGYAFGTMHSDNENIKKIVKSAANYLDSVDVLLVEIKMDKNTTAQSLNILKYAIVKDTSYSLKKSLGEKKYSKLKNALQKKYNINLAMYERFYPIIIYSMILQQQMKQQSQANVSDVLLQTIATEKNKEVAGLETPEEQMQALTSLSYDKQAEMLYKSATKKSKSSMKKLIKAYLNQDLETLYKLSTKWEVPEEYKDVMIFNRNKIMVERSLPYYENNKKFLIAVGALHLAGKEGILNLLKQKGFTVEPVKLDIK